MRTTSPLNIWIWRDCEPIPIDPGNPRLMRAGMFATRLAAAGHNVRWFNSTFDHYQKRMRTQPHGQYMLTDGLVLELLDGPGYTRNTSPKRFIHNWLVSKRAVQRASQLVQHGQAIPDIMVLDMPMPEMALQGVLLAERWGIPSVLSIRDLWPDFFEKFLSPMKAKLARPLIAHMDHGVTRACRNATSIVGISEGYLNWALKKAGRGQGINDTILPLGYSPMNSDLNKRKAREELQFLGVDFSKSLVCFIGSWGQTYDLQYLLNTAILLSERKDIQFIIAGDGEQAEALRERMKSQPNIICPGWLDRNQIAQLMNDSQIAIAPYRTNSPQGMPNKLFEYMSAGLYQVATFTGEGAKLLHREKLGTAVDMRDPKAAANAIKDGIDYFANDTERQRIRNYFDLHFNADKIYTEYQQHLENLVAQNRNKRD